MEFPCNRDKIFNVIFNNLNLSQGHSGRLNTNNYDSNSISYASFIGAGYYTMFRKDTTNDFRSDFHKHCAIMIQDFYGKIMAGHGGEADSMINDFIMQVNRAYYAEWQRRQSGDFSINSFDMSTYIPQRSKGYKHFDLNDFYSYLPEYAQLGLVL